MDLPPKPDPKYLDIPNINFSLIDRIDTRDGAYSEDRKNRGFDDSETWSLCNTIASFIIPRLERYIEIAEEILDTDSEDKRKILLFLEALKLINRDNGAWNFTEEEHTIIEEGLKSFPDIFQTLWW